MKDLPAIKFRNLASCIVLFLSSSCFGGELLILNETPTGQARGEQTKAVSVKNQAIQDIKSNKLIPYAITLTTDAKAPIFLDGENVGDMMIPSGTIVNVISLSEDGTLKLRHNTTVFVANYLSTSLIEDSKKMRSSQGGENASSESNESGEPRTIQGAYAVDIYGNLKGIGFKINDTIYDGETQWHCTSSEDGVDYVADVLGISMQNIRATVMANPNKLRNASSEFLGYIASLTYKNSNPNSTRAWVAQNVGRNTSTVVGDVRFTLKAVSNTLNMLTIEPVR